MCDAYTFLVEEHILDGQESRIRDQTGSIVCGFNRRVLRV